MKKKKITKPKPKQQQQNNNKNNLPEFSIHFFISNALLFFVTICITFYDYTIGMSLAWNMSCVED